MIDLIWNVFKLVAIFIIPPLVSMPLILRITKTKGEEFIEKYKGFIYFGWALISIVFLMLLF